MKKSPRESALPLFSSVFLSIFLVGCSSTVLVAVPPRIDLERYNTIGIVDFSSEPTDQLSRFTTQKFMHVVQASQPNVRFLELGPADQLLDSVNRRRIDPETIKILGTKYNVDTIFTGAYEISNLSPQVRFGQDLSSLSASLGVKILLTVRHWHAKDGATLWTNSRSGRWSLANVDKGAGGPIYLSVRDPSEKYGKFMEQLVVAVTDDFRIRYERRKVAEK